MGGGTSTSTPRPFLDASEALQLLHRARDRGDTLAEVGAVAVVDHFAEGGHYLDTAGIYEDAIISAAIAGQKEGRADG